MEWATLYCPNPTCAYYGHPFPQSRLVKNGTSYGQPQALCRACGTTVMLRYGTAYAGLRGDPAQFEMAVRTLAEGNSLRGTARILQIDKGTALAWLDRAAQQARRVLLSLWHDLHITECQLDELWSFVHTKERHLDCALRCAAGYGDAWIWLAFAPRWRLVLAFVVGKRTQEQADLLVQRVVAVTDPTIPFFTSAQLAEYRQALLAAYGQWIQPARQGPRGRYPKPRLVPPPDLVYAQVVKKRAHGRVVAVHPRLVFGQAAQLATALRAAPRSRHVNTSFVERANLLLRTHNAPLTRKTLSFSKELPWLERHLWLTLACYHLVWPHRSLREAGHGPLRTPAMAAGVTDHIWTTTELLGYRVPAAFLATLSQRDHLFPPLD